METPILLFGNFVLIAPFWKVLCSWPGTLSLFFGLTWKRPKAHLHIWKPTIQIRICSKLLFYCWEYFISQFAYEEPDWKMDFKLRKLGFFRFSPTLQLVSKIEVVKTDWGCSSFENSVEIITVLLNSCISKLPNLVTKICTK